MLFFIFSSGFWSRFCHVKNKTKISIDVELLISSIQERPPLWDQYNKKYMDRDVAIYLWKEVAAECNTTDG